jgi:hypothetical protein
MLFRFARAFFLGAMVATGGIALGATGCTANAAAEGAAYLGSGDPATSDSTATAGADSAQSSSTSVSGAAKVDACTAEVAWRAHGDLTFEDEGDGSARFIDVMNRLIAATDQSPVVVSSHLEPHCIWKATISADDDVSNLALAGHAATSTQILRRPQGLFTTSPQATGWMHVVDATSQPVWIPLADITASAKYTSTDCSELSVRATATIPESAWATPLNTDTGPTTLGALLGKKTSFSPAGWKVHAMFSAEVSR